MCCGLNSIGLKSTTSMPFQALLLYNIGEDEVVIRDLKDRGYYHGSNVSYNIKKLTEFNYLQQERSTHDRRSIRLKLTDKGLRLRDGVRDLQSHLAAKIDSSTDLHGELDGRRTVDAEARADLGPTSSATAETKKDTQS